MRISEQKNRDTFLRVFGKLRDECVCGRDYIIKDNRYLFKCICFKCGKNRGFKREGSLNKMCIACSDRTIHTNKFISNDTRRKMSESQKNNKNNLNKTRSQDVKNRLSIKQKEYCKKYGNQFKGKKHTKESVALISQHNIGKDPRWRGRVFIYDGPKGKFKMRSSWELAYANWMDNRGINWDYEPQFILSDGRGFAPDFKVYQYNTYDIIEIKGYFTPRGKEKWSRFCKDYPKISKKILFEEDLRKIKAI